ncbi:MAG: M1 family aminopeptidase [Flavisolibacter sp.]
MRRWFLLVSCLISFAGFSQEIDVLHYTFTIDLNDKTDTIDCSATITFVNNKRQSKVFFDLANVNADGKGMRVESVIEENAEWGRLETRQEEDKLFITLNNNLQKDTERVTIFYKGVPRDGLIISKNKYGDRTFFADNWPNRAHNWIPCVDNPADKATFEFTVTAPSKYKIISNGKLIEDYSLSNGMKLVHWKEATPLPTKVMVIGVAKFAVKTFADSPPNVPVSAWVYQQDSAKGFHDYAPAPGIVKFFSNYIGPFPYEKLANVQSKTIFGGMENASAIFYFEGSVTGNGGVEDLLTHEIAHQWFGDMASEKSFTHLWLSEGFATYLTDVYWQQKFGEEAFRKRLQKERDQVIQFVKMNDHPVVDSLSSYMDLLNANSYQKGAWVLHMLRNEVGDSTFHKIIRSYYQQFKGGNANTRDFESVAERVSGQNLKCFFDQWLYQPGIPKFTVEWKGDGNKIMLHLEQTTSTVFQFPLEVGVVSSNGKIIFEKLTVKSKEEDYKLDVPFTTKKLVLDPNTSLLFEGSAVAK